MPKRPVPDMAVPFGYKIGWFALSTEDPRAAADALGLENPKASAWAEGVTAAYQDQIFVTPPICGWTLAAGWPWLRMLNRDPGAVVGPALRSLSRKVGKAQMFVSYRVAEYHLWAKAQGGRLLRGYCYVGEAMETVWSQGRPTVAEIELGPFSEDSPPGEEDVVELAARWSVNPCEVDRLITTPSLGLLCEPPVGFPA